MRPRISIRGLVRPLVGPSVGRSVTLSSKSMKNGLLWILSDWDSAGRGRKRNKEEGGTRRNEVRGGTRGKEEGATRRKEQRGEWKNEKVVKKWKMKKWLEDASLTSGSCFSPSALFFFFSVFFRLKFLPLFYSIPYTLAYFATFRVYFSRPILFSIFIPDDEILFILKKHNRYIIQWSIHRKKCQQFIHFNLFCIALTFLVL